MTAAGAAPLTAAFRLASWRRPLRTEPSRVAWFDWPRQDLGGATPRELLADPLRLPELLLAAGSTRSTAFA